MHHIWAFRRLFEYVSYKAPEQGVSVMQVEPNHTSQRCSRADCGSRTTTIATVNLCVPEVRLRSKRGLQRCEEHRATIRPKADTQTPFLANVGERRRKNRPACEWWDVERRESPANCWRLIAGSPHQIPICERACPFAWSVGPSVPRYPQGPRHGTPRE